MICCSIAPWLFLLLGSPPQKQPGWTWVFGRLENERRHEEYETFARRMFAGYQARGQFRGRVVAEEDLSDRPEAPVVFAGPLEAFEHVEWLALDLDRGGRGVTLGDRKLPGPRTGIFLRDRAGTRVVFTGLSLAGFRDIFGVRTGRRACTATVDGRARFEGDYTQAGLELDALPFQPPFPDLSELEARAPAAQEVETAEVYSDEAAGSLTSEFEARLLSLVEGRRVLFVGESHWNVGVNRLFNVILSTLLEAGGVTGVVLEVDYSFSAHYDHYASLADDAEARAFLESELHPLVHAPSTLETLDRIRRWNRDHPSQRVRVACSDLDFDVQKVVERVLEPYFRSFQPDFRVSRLSLLSTRARAGELARMRRLLEGRQDVREQHPFLTREFVGNVLTNVADTLDARVRPDDRRAAIIRNVTEFHGGLLEDGLTVFKGGGAHAVKAPGTGDPGWEGAYLYREHPPTKGRVATLMICGIGYGFAEVAGVDFSTRMRSADLYHDFVQRYRAGLEYGGAIDGEAYRLEDRPLLPVEEAVVLSGLRSGSNVLRVVRPATDYDELVYVLRSQLERTRALEPGEEAGAAGR